MPTATRPRVADYLPKRSKGTDPNDTGLLWDNAKVAWDAYLSAGNPTVVGIADQMPLCLRETREAFIARMQGGRDYETQRQRDAQARRDYEASLRKQREAEEAERKKGDPEKKAREAAAIAYVASYTGTWGLPLDIRADRKWGTKYLRLTDRQVEVLLDGKARDEARAKVTTADPRQAKARAFVVAQVTVRDGFEMDMQRLGESGRAFTENQLAAIERWEERSNVPSTPQAAGLAAQPSAQPTVVRPVTEGMYRTPDGTIFKVQRAVHGSGQLYAKRLVVTGESGTFEFESGSIRRLRAEYRMTVEEAAEFGQLYGWCCVCGRTLTNEESIAAGIGPVCAGKV